MVMNVNLFYLSDRCLSEGKIFPFKSGEREDISLPEAHVKYIFFKSLNLKLFMKTEKLPEILPS